MRSAATPYSAEHSRPPLLAGRSSAWASRASMHGLHCPVRLWRGRRGSPTAAAITTAFTSPRPGFTPILASLGESQPAYTTLNPPTVILSKSEAGPGMPETLVFGAAQVGIAQGVLDAVAEHVLD